MFKIIGFYQGKIAKLKGQDALTAICKNPILGTVTVHRNNFMNDEVANLKHHGGPDRIVHQYSKEHYDYWKKVFPQSCDAFFDGSYGENITSLGISEKDVCFGDRLRIGSVVLEVSEARKPCATLNHRYCEPQFLKELLSTTHWGWFYRVIEEGTMTKKDVPQLLERPFPKLIVADAIEAIFHNKKNPSLCADLAKCPKVSIRWQEYANRAL